MALLAGRPLYSYARTLPRLAERTLPRVFASDLPPYRCDIRSGNRLAGHGFDSGSPCYSGEGAGATILLPGCTSDRVRRGPGPPQWDLLRQADIEIAPRCAP